MIYYGLWIIMFSVTFQNLQINFSDDDYPSLGAIFKILLQAYRNSTGDISAPGYAVWIPKSDKDYLLMGITNSTVENIKRRTIICLIWIMWLYNQFLNLIILLNFLIAVISQVYDTVVATQNLVTYKHRAEMNLDYFMMADFWSRKQKGFLILVFSLVNQESEQGEDDWLGFVASIKSFT